MKQLTILLLLFFPLIASSQIGGEAEVYLTGDKIEMLDATNVKSPFRLLGRLDRIVKLEEKRLSLDAIEQKIIELDEIAQCHV